MKETIKVRALRSFSSGRGSSMIHRGQAFDVDKQRAVELIGNGLVERVHPLEKQADAPLNKMLPPPLNKEVPFVSTDPVRPGIDKTKNENLPVRPPIRTGKHAKK